MSSVLNWGPCGERHAEPAGLVAAALVCAPLICRSGETPSKLSDNNYVITLMGSVSRELGQGPEGTCVCSMNPWLRAEPSGDVTHMSGTWARVTRRLASAGTVGQGTHGRPVAVARPGLPRKHVRTGSVWKAESRVEASRPPLTQPLGSPASWWVSAVTACPDSKGAEHGPHLSVLKALGCFETAVVLPKNLIRTNVKFKRSHNRLCWSRWPSNGHISLVPACGTGWSHVSCVSLHVLIQAAWFLGTSPGFGIRDDESTPCLHDLCVTSGRSCHLCQSLPWLAEL